MAKSFRQWIDRIGIDGLVLTICCVIGIVLSAYDLAGGNQLNGSLLIGILSLLVLEMVFQRVRLDKVREELIRSLKGVRAESFTTGKDFADTKYRLLLETEDHIHDTELCLPPKPSTSSALLEQESAFRQLLNERITKGEITYKYVQVVHDRLHLESLLRKLFQFSGYKYYLGYFVGGSETIPVLNVMSFDDKHFLVGGYYGPSGRGEDRNLYIQHEDVQMTLRQYFDYLWSKARLLNENRATNWDEVKRCGLQLGYTLDELNVTIKRIAQEVGFTDIKELQP